MPTLYILTGQTATGKTERALALAAKDNGVLINCDSRQIYTYLDIISGKDLTNNNFHQVEKLNNFNLGYYVFNTEKNPHLWLYDIISPKDYFSSFDYQTCALHVIKKVLAENKTPILVGGTYFYIYHLLYDVASESIQPNWQLRDRLKDAPIEMLQHELKKTNPELFEQLNHSEKQNPQRLIRKIEISLVNKEFTQNGLQNQITLAQKLAIPELNIVYQGLKYVDRDAEFTSLDKRVTKRMKEGAVEEVEHLLKMGFTENDPGMKTIGYQQMIKYLKGIYTKDDMLKAWITREMQYAKRQFTFMKKDPNILWEEV